MGKDLQASDLCDTHVLKPLNIDHVTFRPTRVGQAGS